MTGQVNLLEFERVTVARRIVSALRQQPGIDVVPARADQFLNKLTGLKFIKIGQGKSRYVYAIESAVCALGLVLKLGGKAQNALEIENTLRHPEDFPKVYDSFTYGIVSQQAEMLDLDAILLDPRPKSKQFTETLALLKHRYGDVNSNIGFLEGRLVIVDGGVPFRAEEL